MADRSGLQAAAKNSRNQELGARRLSEEGSQLLLQWGAELLGTGPAEPSTAQEQEEGAEPTNGASEKGQEGRG